MQTATQVKTTPSPTQTPVGKTRQLANAAPPVNERAAPVNDEQPENATRLGHSLGAISVLPPDPPVQPKRATGVVSRLTAFNSPSQGNATAIPNLPASWTVRPPIQAKLTVGQPNDQYEQEADQVADQVMRMPEPQVQAKCACGGEAGPDGECAACKAKRLTAETQVQTKADHEEIIQTKADTEPTEAAPDLESRLNRSRGSGAALPEATRSSMESALGVDFGGVRVHTGNDAVQMNHELSAQAFTHGSDIYFDTGKYEPGSVEGKGLLAHELTHVVQQNGDVPEVSPTLSSDLPASARSSREPSPMLRRQPDDEVEDSPNVLPPKPAVAEDTLTQTGPRVFTPRIDSREPDLLIVPGDAKRSDIARQLFNNETLTANFDIVITPVTGKVDNLPEQAVRVRNTARLTHEVGGQLRTALETQLRTDESHTIALLLKSGLNDSESLDVTQRALRWSQRSEILDESGENYFDRYLDALASHKLSQPHWYTLTLTETERNGLDWLLKESSYSEQIEKAIALRSKKRTTGYKVTDRGPALNPGDVAGRFYWGTGEGASSGLQLFVNESLGPPETTLERAETAARSSPWLGIRIVVPGSGGLFYGYSIVHTNLDLMIQGPEEGATGHYYWYHPGTILIESKEFRADFPVGGAAEKTQRKQILQAALDEAVQGKHYAVIGLDFDVLSTADLNQRLRLTSLAIDEVKSRSSGYSTLLKTDVKGQDPWTSLLMRLLLSTPSSEFSFFERRLSENGDLKKLLALGGQEVLSVIGRVFTLQTLSSIPVGVEALANLQTLQVGEDSAGTFHFAFGDARQIDSKVVPREKWPPTAAPTVGREPAMPGEPAGHIPRVGIAFLLGTSASLSSGINWSGETKVFLPTELVRLEMGGAHPETRICTALEAAGILGQAAYSTAAHRFGQLININLWAMSALSLARAFGPALAEAFGAASMREAAGILFAAAGTTAGKQALMGALLLGAMNVVDAYREELNKSPEGRAFLAVFDIGMAVLVAHDVYKLMSSGLLDKLSSTAAAALRIVTGTVRSSLAELSQLFDALLLTIKRGLSEGALVERVGADGVKTLVPANELTLGQIFMQSRAEVAGRAITTALGEAKIETKTAERVLKQLQALAKDSEELGQAWSAVARRASSLAAKDIDAYLLAVEELLKTRPGASKELANFLRASAKAAAPINFLNEVKALVTRPGVTNEALQMLGDKALEGKVDIPWLNKLTLSDADLSALAENKMTNWNGFKSAIEGGKRGPILGAIAKVRGAAAEHVAEETLGEVVPGYRLVRRQVEVPGAVVDFELMATDGTGRRIGFEVKGYSGDKWRDALNAWAIDQKNQTLPLAQRVALSKEQENNVKMLKDAIKQVKAEQAAYPAGVKLGVTTGLSGPTEEKLKAFLEANLPGVEMVSINEAKIAETARRFRTGLGLEVPVP